MSSVGIRAGEPERKLHGVGDREPPGKAEMQQDG